MPRRNRPGSRSEAAHLPAGTNLDPRRQRPLLRPLLHPCKECRALSLSHRNTAFQPQGPVGSSAALRPNSRRNREFLEGFSLDTLKMVGTFKVGGSFYGLVQSKDGLVHKVQPGNYLGQNDGKVTEITGGKISLVEIIPDGLGGYIERPASLALAN